MFQERVSEIETLKRLKSSIKLQLKRTKDAGIQQTDKLKSD